MSARSALFLTLVVLLAAAAWWRWTPDKDPASLQRKYLDRPGDLVDVAGTTLHVRGSGPREAPAVILIHGLGASLQTWDAWAAALQSDHRVIRLDLPGSGLSPPERSDHYGDDRSVQLLVALQELLKVPRASVIGHSIGGRIAWTFAAVHFERVDRLVLVAPDGFASPGFAYGEAPKIPSALEALRCVLPKALLRLNLRSAYADPGLLTDAVVTRYHGPPSRATCP